MQKQIFIINGSAGVGKDSFVSLVRKNFEQSVENFSSVDKVKEIAKIIGWDGSKSEKDRKFLSDLKLLCTQYNDMPFNTMSKRVESFKKNDSVMLFLHIREPEEIERAKLAFNAKTLLVTRDAVKQVMSNSADANVFNYQYDITISNDSEFKCLIKKAVEFSNDFKKECIKSNY